MKILLINNHTLHLESLNQSLAGHEVEVQDYKPGLKFNDAGKDLVVLSGGGGEGLEIHDEHQPGQLWYADEMRFVKTCQKPIIGICMGFEVICRAYGAKVSKMRQGVDQIFVEFDTTPAGSKLFGQAKLKQFESHDWRVAKAPAGFEILAQSPDGIEVIKHQSKPIFGTQFHPEKGGTLTLPNLLQTLTI